MSNEKILSYSDVVLRRSDLDILSGRHFLNDRIIEFYFSYLASCYPSEDILLVPPSISFWIGNCPDLESLKDFVEPLKFPDKKMVIFTVNDNEDVSMAEGGCHWSLLAYERKKNVFVHHDSLAGSNRWHAKRLYKVVVRFMGISATEVDAPFIDCTTSPQQINGYDCGLYVTAIAKVICEWYVTGRSEDMDLWFTSLKTKITTSTVSNMRSEILLLIKDLMVKK
ncbi:Sentrin-specific protease [Thalictrum thalictroides]|uniref:Sentrin-specific protease n=1 Tax=Thalictrum thalictroides TaxID=46969 RepID=A0A7J6VHN4_THATH|nr:Sentrin-specific protease [Thalictrum thalictroides]